MSKWKKINNDSNSNSSNNNSEPSKQENIKIQTPTLSSGMGGGSIVLYVGFTIQLEGHYAEPNAMDTITDWKLYKKVGNTYNLVNGYEVEIDKGERKI